MHGDEPSPQECAALGATVERLEPVMAVRHPGELSGRSRALLRNYLPVLRGCTVNVVLDVVVLPKSSVT